MANPIFSVACQGYIVRLLVAVGDFPLEQTVPRWLEEARLQALFQTLNGAP